MRAGFGEQPALRFAADVNVAVAANRDDRRHEGVAAAVANDDRHAVLHVGDEAVRGAEIDADDSAHVLTRPYRVSSRSIPASRLLM